MPTTKKTYRPVLTLLRGMAVIGMIVYHVFVALDFMEIAFFDFRSGVLLVLARVVQFLFLGLVGVSLAISESNYLRHFIRGLRIFSLGLMITGITYLFVSEVFVRFGILHFIGISVILLAPFRRHKYFGLFGGIAAALIGFLVHDIETTNFGLYIIGFDLINHSTLDYFPIFPWSALVFFGIFIGNIIKKYPPLQLQHIPFLTRSLLLIGQNSLLVYMIHVPLILLVLGVFFAKS